MLNGGRLLAYGAWALALLTLVWPLARALVAHVSDPDAALTPGALCRMLLTVVAGWSTLYTLVVALLLVTPLTFFHLVFLPCFTCFDFEAAATHEVGHVLGLGHPDADMAASVLNGAPPGRNVYHLSLIHI